ncbi:MAG: hypothetical protein U0522_02200 [Candidatus Paceibacterota bacterium]
MNFLKSWSFWFSLVAGFVLSWLVFGPVSAFITLGIIAMVGGLTFLAWWVCGVIIARLADPKVDGGTKFFIKAQENCDAVVMHGGTVHKMFHWKKGEHLCPSGSGEVLPGDFERSFIHRLYGYEWIGWYPIFKPLRWKFAWEKVDGDKIVPHEPEEIQLHFCTYQYGMEIDGVEDSKQNKLKFRLSVQLRTRNVHKTLFGTSSNPGDWINRVKVAIFSGLLQYAGKEGRTFETIIKGLTTSGGRIEANSELIQALMAVNEKVVIGDKEYPGIMETVGQEIVEIKLVAIEAPPEYIAGQLEIQRARQEAEMKLAAAPGIEAEGKAKANVEEANLVAKAKGEEAMLKAQAEGYGAIATAGNGAGAAMYMADKYSQVKGTLVLGQVPGVTLPLSNDGK